jgi:cyclopropane-fatty-acyl-phospholipid synthase
MPVGGEAFLVRHGGYQPEMSDKAETIMRDLLAAAGIGTDGAQPWDMRVHDRRAYKRMLYEGIMGFGESYMDGWWDCDRLDECIAKLIRGNLEEQFKRDLRLALHVGMAKLWNLQSTRRAFEVGEEHYDVGNDLFEAMLDERMVYSCAYWKDAKTLGEAQEAKLDLVCRKVGLEPGMKVLDIGCGWGSFGKYAAERYGAEVTGITVSKQQVALGTEMCKGLPVEFRLQDYREVSGRYDAVVSIGMIEHVGYKNYRAYMETVHRCLNDKGIAFIHTIGSNNCVTIGNPWFHKYIFPNNMLPSIGQLGRAMNQLFVMEDWHNFGPDYDPTLMAWYRNFDSAWPSLTPDYDERFYRMWTFYLLSAAAGFRSRRQQLWQIVMSKKGRDQPDCRVS